MSVCLCFKAHETNIYYFNFQRAMADELPSPDTYNSNTVAFLIMATVYIYYKAFSSDCSSFSFVKGRINSIGGLFLKLSILSLLIYNICLNFLSLKFRINKVELEILESISQTYTVVIKKYSIDIAKIMIYSLKISQLLFMSSLFICISMLIPDGEEQDQDNIHLIDSSITNNNSSIGSVCKLWAIFRIPILYYSTYLHQFFYKKISLFLSLIFCSTETFLAALCILVIKYKNQKLIKHLGLSYSVDTILFAMAIIGYGALKYLVNLVDLPFEVTTHSLNIIVSYQIGLSLGIYLMMASIVFPKKKKHLKDISGRVIKNEISITPDISLLDSVIEFEKKIIN